MPPAHALPSPAPPPTRAGHLKSIERGASFSKGKAPESDEATETTTYVVTETTVAEEPEAEAAAEAEAGEKEEEKARAREGGAGLLCGASALAVALIQSATRWESLRGLPDVSVFCVHLALHRWKRRRRRRRKRRRRRRRVAGWVGSYAQLASLHLSEKGQGSILLFLCANSS